ncbi:MAG: carboxypeptidase-like regulatory domain-containing protein [Planctomycetota bacterium]
MIDDVPAGLLLVSFGGRKRTGPTLQIRAGVDRDVTAVLEGAWTIRGRVVDGAGRTVGGATVRGLGVRGPTGTDARTDPDGRFRWRGPVHLLLSLRVEAPGWAPVSMLVVPPLVGTLRTDVGDVVLTAPAVTVEGRVLATTIAADAEVRVEPAVAAYLREIFGPEAAFDASTSAPLAPDGSFSVGGLPPGLPLRVSVRGAGQPVDHLVEAGPGEVVPLRFTPPRGHVLAGKVIDRPTGQPAVGLRLLLSAEPADGPDPRPGDRAAVTDGRGRFQVEGLARGSLWIRAYPPDRDRLIAQVQLPRTDPVGLWLESPPAVSSEQAAARRVEGQVVSDLLEPLAGVTVRAEGRVARTDAEGRFVLDNVIGEAGRVALTCGYEPGPLAEEVDPVPYATSVRLEAIVGAPRFRVILPRAAHLRFRALDGVDDSLLASLHLVLRTDEGSPLIDRAIAPRDGVVTLEGLPARVVSLALFSSRHRLVRSVRLEPGETTDLGDLRLARGIHIEGRVENAEGEPVSGAWVSGLDEGWLHHRTDDSTVRRELALRRVRAAADGTFVIDGFDPKRPAVLAVWAPGYAPTSRRIVLEEFRNNVHAQLAVRLRRGGHLALELVESGTDRPISGALLDLEDGRNGADYLDVLRRGMLGGHVGSDDGWRLASQHFLMERGAAGRYLVGPIEPGPYEVWVDRPGYKPLKRRLTVLDPGDALIDTVRGTSHSMTEVLKQIWEMDPGP